MRGLHGLRTVMSSCLFTARVNPQSIEQGVTQTTIKRGSCSQVCCAQHPTRLMVRYGLNFVHTQPLASLDLPCPLESGGARAERSGTASGPLLARYDRPRPLFARADRIVVNCGEDRPGRHTLACTRPLRAAGHALCHVPHRTPRSEMSFEIH